MDSRADAQLMIANPRPPLRVELNSQQVRQHRMLQINALRRAGSYIIGACGVVTIYCRGRHSVRS